MSAPVVNFKCPACVRRSKRRFDIHSLEELDACDAMREGISVEEAHRRRMNREARWAANRLNETTMVEEVTFVDEWMKFIHITFDIGSVSIFHGGVPEPAHSSLTVPVPPVGTVFPNWTYGQRRIDEIKEDTFERRMLQRRQEALRIEMETKLLSFHKTIAEVRLLHLPKPRTFEE